MEFLAVTDGSFEAEVLKAGLPVLVVFWAPKSVLCAQQEPILRELAEKYDGRVKFFKFEGRAGPEILREYNIFAFPTLVLFLGGENLGSVIGAVSRRDIARMIERALGA